MESLISSIQEIVSKKNLCSNVNMSEYTSFKVGGNAKLLVKVNDTDELKAILMLLDKMQISYVILGNGTNTLFRDSGYNGVVIKLQGEFSDINIRTREEVESLLDDAELDAECQYIESGAAVLMSALGKFTSKESITGFEFASGIPGSVGGGVFMNAGAYGGEIKDILVGAKVMSSNGKREEFISVDKLDLSYRHSAIEETGGIILSAVFRLKKGNRDEIQATMADLTQKRNSKQPVQYPSAGSFFKRPEGYFAGKLIQDAGLKGLSVGGAKVSEQHSGFIINTGGATETDISELMIKVQEEVMKKFGVKLEPEVRFIGE